MKDGPHVEVNKLMSRNDQDAQLFGRQLNGLKQDGCNLLVVNDAESADAVCRRSLGEQRRHLFIPTTTTVKSVLDRHAPTPRDSSMLGVIDATAAAPTRSATAINGPANFDTTADWYDRIDHLDDLGQLGRLANNHLTRFSRAESAIPGEIRLCFESLDPFFDSPDTERLFKFLHLLTARVRDVQGIGHFHAASGIDGTDLDIVTSLFDATVHVHADADTIRQRWQLHNSGYDSGWINIQTQDSTATSH